MLDCFALASLFKANTVVVLSENLSVGEKN